MTGKWAWAGIAGGALFWYGAHELGFYFSKMDCHQPWILPLLHILTLAGCLGSGWLSWRVWSAGRGTGAENLVAAVGVAAAALFALVVLQQGIGTIIFSGCER